VSTTFFLKAFPFRRWLQRNKKRPGSSTHKTA